ncbi:hypothetical protein K491DRAFT_707260 [Lophiostoma macrostomum CBS 122681]|uniref:AB hydrolase-1 domain-containing protein n=1 Tax=Lophiostoma macrostomum CBS 122681 TaxID=1314788 RepID=A0A6A6SWU1_9PLEO|nr:hypothetical protein K491DRAFT_707260 [Lophiostoma macrostomum CBS 122681]
MPKPTRLTRLLTASNYETYTPHLPPSILPGCTPIPSRAPDIAIIRDLITTLARDRGLDIFLVAHSNSGISAGTALRGLSKLECRKNGRTGGVVKMVYICAFLVPEGFAQCVRGTRQGLIPEMRVDEAAQTVTVLPQDVKKVMYQDLSDEEVAEVAKTLVKQSLAPFYEKTEYAAWRVVDTTFVVTLGDMQSTVQAVEWMVKSSVESEPSKVGKVIRREVGHAPFWSQPEWTAGMLVREAGEVVG